MNGHMQHISPGFGIYSVAEQSCTLVGKELNREGHGAQCNISPNYLATTPEINLLLFFSSRRMNCKPGVPDPARAVAAAVCMIIIT